MQTVTALVYWVIVSIWLAVLITVSAAYLKNPRTFGAVRLLLTVVGIDTVRNIIENFYFGLYFGSQYGIFPNAIVGVLGNPYLLIMPKLINILAACVVLSLLLFRWLPIASEERTAADKSIEQKSTALNQQIDERRRLFETSQDLILIVDPPGVLVQVSPSAEEILGYKPEEMIGHSIERFVFSDDVNIMRSTMVGARGGDPMRNLKTNMVRKDSGIVPLLWMGTSSDPDRIYLIGRDMTEIQQAEIALRESEHLARGIVETALDAFVQLDANGRIIDWSTQAENIFGWSGVEATGSMFSDLVNLEFETEREQQELAKFIAADANHSIGKRFQVKTTRRDQQELQVELSVTAFKRRQFIVFNCFIRDLTEKIAAESQIRQAQKIEAVGQLTGGVAHDFNNILTVITGTIEILADAVAANPELSAITKMIDAAAGRGADLTRQLLAFARKQPLQPRTVDVNELLVNASKLLRPTLGEQIEIETILAGGAWLAFADATQLTTTIINLAINARDAMPNGGKLVLETLNCQLDENYASQHNEVKAGEYVMLAVSDTGTGIASDILDKVFEPFFTTKGGNGSGLGLSMVYGFVKQSNGHIKIYSEQGHGTTIKIYLPKSVELLEENEEVSFDERIDGGDELVLIVEDDVMVRNYVTGQIRSLGYRTLHAAHAEEALKWIRQDRSIDLLFTDIIMPGPMNGRQLAEECLKIRTHLKILYTSGYTENAIVHHGRLDDGVLLLAKPYRKADLARMIREALERKPSG